MSTPTEKTYGRILSGILTEGSHFHLKHENEAAQAVIAAFKERECRDGWRQEIDAFVRNNPDCVLGHSVSATALKWLKERDELKNKSSEGGHREKSPWIACSERMPTKEDEGTWRTVLWRGKRGAVSLGCCESSRGMSDWMPIPPLPEPEPEDAFEKAWPVLKAEAEKSLCTVADKDMARRAWNAAMKHQKKKKEKA